MSPATLEFQSTSIWLPPGELNDKLVLRDKDGNLVVKRTPKENLAIRKQLEAEYQGVGYLAQKGEYHFRSLRQQADFMSNCNSLGLAVLKPISINEASLIVPYVEGDSYSEFLKRKVVPEVITKYLADIFSAHKKGIIYGDRWGPNTIVNSQKEIYQVDFDIALTGPVAPEFELAQAFYYTLYFAENRELATRTCLSLFTNDRLKSYKTEVIRSFLIGHTRHFRNKEYGGIEKEIKTLTGLLR